MQLPAHTDTSGNVLSIFKLIDNELGRVETLVNKQLTDCPDKTGVGRLLEHFSACSGKMLRPGLVLLAGKSVGEITDRHIHTAAIVEMIHNATLLHDDVIDEGQKRRGLPTINSLCGNESAVLLGDFLLSRVLKMCVDLEPRFQRIIADATARICEGELMQTAQKQNWQLSESEYIDIITEKTAALFSSCCELGGFLAGGSESQARSLADFGLNFGIAFQITDDLFDIIGDESKTGKTPGSDIDKNKLTLSVIHLLRAADEGRRVHCVSHIAHNDKKALAEMLGRFGSLEYANSRAEEFVAKAIGALAGLKEGDAKGALIETAKFVGRRGI